MDFGSRLHYICSKTKYADKLRCYQTADLHLCFCTCKRQIFSWSGSFYVCSIVYHEFQQRLAINYIFSLLAHLSRRLTVELIGYPWIRRPSVVRPSTFSNIFSSETAWPIKTKFYVEPPWEGGTKVYINGPGHMTKMAAMPIYGKNPSKIFFSRTSGPIFKKLDM